MAELDVHGLHPVPQLLGAVMAAAAMAAYPRQLCLRAIESGGRAARGAARGHHARWVTHVQQASGSFGRGPAAAAPGKGRATDVWWGVPAERRWAMEVFGFTPRRLAGAGGRPAPIPPAGPPRPSRPRCGPRRGGGTDRGAGRGSESSAPRAIRSAPAEPPSRGEASRHEGHDRRIRFLRLHHRPACRRSRHRRRGRDGGHHRGQAPGPGPRHDAEPADRAVRDPHHRQQLLRRHGRIRRLRHHRRPAPKAGHEPDGPARGQRQDRRRRHPPAGGRLARTRSSSWCRTPSTR